MMSSAFPIHNYDDASQAWTLAAAVAQAEANPTRVPHEDARPWLLRLAAGAFDAAPPKMPRKALLASAPLGRIDLDRDRDIGRDVDL